MKKLSTLLFTPDRRKTQSSMGKRLIASLCLLAGLTGSLSAQNVPKNDAFYLVGSMNGWTTVSENEAVNYEYKLTDPDGDGIYTGSFDIPAQDLEFKVFSAPGGWDDAPYYGFAGLRELYVFNEDLPDVVMQLNDGSASGNIAIANWQGGTMTMSIKWEATYSGDFVPGIYALKGSNQPALPEAADIYIIGNFNNWQLPTASLDNGALKSSYNTLTYFGLYYSLTSNFNTGDLRLTACKFDRKTNEYEFLKLDSYYDVPFSLYKFPGIYSTGNSVVGKWVSSSNPESLAVQINDWQGGDIRMYIDDLFDGSGDITFYNVSDVVTEFPSSSIYIVTENNGTKEIFPANNIADYYYQAYAYCNGENVSILFTTENSVNPKPENCWGIASTLAEEGFGPSHTTGKVAMVKGGKPFSYTFDPSGELFVSIDLTLNQAFVQLTYDNPSNGSMYVVGEVENDGVANGWLEPSQANADFYNKYFKLTETTPGVFEGTYFVPAKGTDLPNFRFYSSLTGWDGGASIGSGYDDFNSKIFNLANGYIVSEIVYGGKGNWSPTMGTAWESNYVQMTVNTNINTLTLKIVDENGIEDIETDLDSDTSESWYNLQGIKVTNPKSGMYIHVKGGKSSVKVLR